MRFASGLVNVGPRFCNPFMLQVAPVTPHRVAMNGANVVVSAQLGSRETFQNDAESSGRDVKPARLDPDTIRIRNPETVVVQVGVGNEVFAASSIWVEAVGEIAEGSNRHMSPFSRLKIEASICVRNY